MVFLGLLLCLCNRAQAMWQIDEGNPCKCSCLLQVFFNWTRGFAEDPELKVILAAHKANTAVHHKRQVRTTWHVCRSWLHFHPKHFVI